MIPYHAPTYFGPVIFQHCSGCIVKWSEIRKKPSNLATRLSGAKFLESVQVPEGSGIRSCLGEREASTPQTATQHHGFASEPGGGKHPHAQDTNSKYGIYRMRITQTFVFASLGRGGLPPPTRDAEPPFCIANSGSGLEKSISTPMRRQKLSIWESA